MALTDIIEADLLATLEGDGDPQAVLDRYAASKGPLYAALARATATATSRFADIRTKLREAQARRRTAEDEACTAEKRAEQAERRAKAAEKREAEAAAKLAEQGALLNRAQALHDAGLDEGSLAALARVFGQVADTAGITPADAVARFLKAATDFEAIATFYLKARAAEARAKAAEVDATQRERQAKVRKVAIDWAEWFVKRGITAEAVGAWKAVADKLGLTAEDLAQGLADASEQFGSLEAACQAKAKERDALNVEADKLKAANAALRAERQRTGSTIDAIAADGSARVAKAEMQAVASIQATGEQYQASIRKAGERMAEAIRHFAEVQREAAELEQYVRWARALASRNPDDWRGVEPETWAAFLRHLGQWVEAAGVNPRVAIPDEVKRISRGSTDYPTLHGRFEVPLLGLTAWLAQGLRAVPAAAVLALADGNGQGNATGHA